MQKRITVVARLKPLLEPSPSTAERCVLLPGAPPNAIEFSSPTASASPFSFDAVFPDSMTQREVIERICGLSPSTTTAVVSPPAVGATSKDDDDNNLAPLDSVLDQVLRGINATILCYGQTGSGKTYTMMGNEEAPGIIPTLARELFRNFARILRETAQPTTTTGDERMSSSSSSLSDTTEITVKVSFIEIYREKLIDLLANLGDAASTASTGVSSPSSATTNNSSSTPLTASSKLRIREENGKISVEGAVERYISDAEELLSVFTAGLSNRSVGSTLMNQDSSRSHSVFTMVIERTTRSHSTSSKLQLVDLAGSEMVKRTGASGERLEEAKSINQSLSCLGNVILALCDEKPHVPYRDSKLTRILQDALGGSASTVLVLNLSQSAADASETLSTLRFGQRAKRVKNVVIANVRRSVEELERLLEVANRRILELTGGGGSSSMVAADARVETTVAKNEDAEEEERRAERETQLRMENEKNEEAIQTLKNEVEDLRAALDKEREAARETARTLRIAETARDVLHAELEQTKMRCDVLRKDMEAMNGGGTLGEKRRGGRRGTGNRGNGQQSIATRKHRRRSLSFPPSLSGDRDGGGKGYYYDGGGEEEEEEENSNGRPFPSSSTATSSSNSSSTSSKMRIRARRGEEEEEEEANRTATVLLREKDVAVLTEKCIQYQVELAEKQEELEYLRESNASAAQEWRRMRRSEEETATLSAQLEAERKRGETLVRRLTVMRTQLENRQEHLDLFESVMRDFQADFKAKMEAAGEREVVLQREVDRLGAALSAATEASALLLVSSPSLASSSSTSSSSILMKKPVTAEASTRAGINRHSKEVEEEMKRSSSTTTTAIVPFTLNNARADIRDLKRLPERLLPLLNHVDAIRVRQRYDASDGKGGTQLGFGNAVYPAAIYMCDYFSRNPALLASKRVLELGAGCGAVSLALASLDSPMMRPALPIICTDGDDDSLELARENVKLNGLEGSIVVRKLLWGGESEKEEEEDYDVVVASDVVATPYAEALEALFRTLTRLASRNPALVIYIAYVPRGAVEERFFAWMRGSFGECTIVTEGIGEDFRRDSEVQLWRFEKYV